MTLEELEKIVKENSGSLCEDAEKNETAYMFITKKDRRGLYAAAGTDVDRVEMLVNVLLNIYMNEGDEEKVMVLQGIDSLTKKMLEIDAQRLLDVLRDKSKGEETLQ